MKKQLKIFSLALVFLLALTIPTSVFAKTNNNGLTETPSYISYGEITVKGIEKPTSTWNLSKQGRYTFSGWCFGHYLYTNYLFTGATSVTIQVENKSVNKITVKLLKKQSGTDWSVSTRTLKAGDTLKWKVTSLNEKSSYYLQFSRGSDVVGYIQ